MDANWFIPPCLHTSPVNGCASCNSWRGLGVDMRQRITAYNSQQHPKRFLPQDQEKIEKSRQISRRAFPTQKEPPENITKSGVNVAPKSERISLPVRPPCKYEGTTLLTCRACNENYKVRHCEHPEAEWDFCARMATPVEHGQNCQTCKLYAT